MSVATVISLGPRIGQLLLGLGGCSLNIHFLQVPVSSFNLLIQLISTPHLFSKLYSIRKLYCTLNGSKNKHFIQISTEFYTTCTYKFSGSHLWQRLKHHHLRKGFILWVAALRGFCKLWFTKDHITYWETQQVYDTVFGNIIQSYSPYILRVTSPYKSI